MCGISGIWNFNGRKIERKNLERFNNSLSHRGPDGEGYFIDESEQLGLGHRRLSILDLSENGRQPMSFADRYHITYNGEIYNFLELKSELEQQGYTFYSNSDTEIILAAYACWGINCLKKFNGMWSFAVWDSRDKKLFLARDRFGIKPLYYLFKQNNFFAFASETIAFKHLNDYERSFDNNKFALSLSNHFLLEGKGHTIYEDIFQLLPGHYSLVEKNRFIIQKRWWSTLDNVYKIEDDYNKQCSNFYSLFESACKLRMRSDVPIASALSGGVDSTAVYCTIHHLMKSEKERNRIPADWQQAFVGTFPDTRFDERKYAEEVLHFTNGKAKFVPPDYSNLISRIVESTKLFDSMYFSPITAGAEIYSAMRRSGVKVSLDGHGADELMYGYPHLVSTAFFYARKLKDEKYSKDLEETFLNLITEAERQNALSQLYPIEQRKKNTAKQIYYHYFPESLKRAIRKLRGKKITPIIKNLSSKADLSLLSDRKEKLLHLNDPERYLYENFHNTVLPTLLRNFDRASMQAGIEIRMPFMDYRLVTFLFSLPLQSKIGGGYTKRILRDSLQGIMPETIRTRKLKIGLNAPLQEWLSGELKEFILDTVSSNTFLQSEIWNGKEIKEFAEEKIRLRSWTWDECMKFWPYMNAHILLS